MFTKEMQDYASKHAKAVWNIFEGAKTRKSISELVGSHSAITRTPKTSATHVCDVSLDMGEDGEVSAFEVVTETKIKGGVALAHFYYNASILDGKVKASGMKQAVTITTYKGKLTHADILAFKAKAGGYSGDISGLN